MRQRYYSPEMKRFLNQDVVRGSLTASQSLNRYSYVQGNPVSYTDPFGLSPLNGLFTGTNFWHAVLGFIGCVPGPVGMVANLADAAIYALIDHDYGMAALAMLDCVSGGLSTLAKAASAAGKATKTARYLKTAGSLISNVSSFAQNAVAGMATAFDMYEKYMIKGENFDSSTPWEIASLGLSIVGMGISGRGMAGDTKALSKMLNEDMISSRMSKALSRQMGGRQTGTPLEYNLQFFGGEGSKDFGAFKKNTDVHTGIGYDAGDIPVRIAGDWTENDMKQALLGHPPRGLGSPDIHHGGQMPGGALHEVLPKEHRNNAALHQNLYNQGVTIEMRMEDRQLHWWYRAREQGADQLLPDWIYD